jgi:hypothetical protein
MTTLAHDDCTTHEACQCETRQTERYANHAHTLLRNSLKRELESEVRGLLMAARVHGFHIEINEGKPMVTEVPV